MADTERSERFILVGIGGVGTHLEPLLRYLSYKRPGTEVLLIDGDFVEERNLERQSFDAPFGNKAEIKAQELTTKFPQLTFMAHPEYVTEANVAVLIPEGSVVFSAVDNHPSRLLISEHMSSLDNGILVSGGNDYHDGNVQIHVRKDGEHLTPPITYMHPEIAEGAKTQRHPADLSCQEAAEAGSPQLVLANNMVASLMAATFWRFEQELEKATANNKPLDFPTPEVYFDLTTGAVRPAKRVMDKKDVDHGSAEDREAGIDPSGRSGGIEAGPGLQEG